MDAGVSASVNEISTKGGDHSYRPLLPKPFPPFKENSAFRSGDSTPIPDDDFSTRRSTSPKALCVGCLARCWCCYKSQYKGIRGTCATVTLQVVLILLFAAQAVFMSMIFVDARSMSFGLEKTFKQAQTLYTVTCSAAQELKRAGISNVTTCPGFG